MHEMAPEAAQVERTLEEKLDALFDGVARSDSPGCVVGIRHGDQQIFRKAFGLASVELGVANGPTTRMRIGSTTKHFTCVAALLLAEEGKLDIDAPIQRYLPELPDLHGEPTLRQLMNHLSGYRCYLDVGFLGNGMAIQPMGAALAAQVRQRAVNFGPGEKFLYCNGGYHLLSICIERASGLTFEEFLKTRIFEPLGMLDTDSAPGDFDIHRGMATLHSAKPDGGWRRGIFPSEEVRGEGGVISTTDDMLRWLALLRTRNAAVMNVSSWEQLMTSGRLVDGRPTHYGLGLMVHPYRGVDVVHHAGGVVGGAAQMLTVPGRSLDIVILTNGGLIDPIATAYKVIDIVLGDELSLVREAVQLADFVALKGARYHSRSSGMVIGFEEAAKPEQAGQLGLSLLGNPAVPLVRDGSKLTLPVETLAIGPVTIDLPPRLESPPPELDIEEGTVTERFERLPENPPTIGEWADELCGTYASHDAAANATLMRDGVELTLHVHGRVGTIVYRLKPLSADVHQCRPTDKALPLSVILNFHRDGSGIAGLTLDSGRTRGLSFARSGN